MSEEWVEAKLGDVANIQQGKTLAVKNMTGGDHPVYGANGIIGWYHEGNSPGTVVALGCRGSCGTVHLPPPGAWLANNVMSVYPKDDPETVPTTVGFLALALEAADLYSTGVITGQVQPQITRQSLAPLTISLPPLSVQRRIVDLLEHLDTHIANLESEDETADEFQRSLLTALLTDHARIPASYDTLFRSEGLSGLTPHASSTSHDGRSGGEWEETTLGVVSSFAGGYSFRPDEQGKSTGELPFIKVSDMNLPGNEIYMNQAANWVDKDALSRLRAKAWDPGTVIFPKVGAALLTEKRRVLRHRSAFDNNIMGLVADKQRLLPEYLFALMCQVKLGEVAQHGAVPSVNQSHLSEIPISLPPLAVQRRIVDLMEHLNTLNAGRNAEIVRLRHLRADLLSSLLAQQTELPDSYDELLGRRAS